MDIVNDKLLFVARTPDALQVKSKFLITNNVGAGLVGNMTLATFDPIGNTITTGTTGTTNSMVGNNINAGTGSTTNTQIRGNNINVGNEIGLTNTATINMKATTTNITGGSTINIEATDIYMGTDGFFNNVNIGSAFSNVRIRSMDNAAIRVGQYLDQLNP